MTDPDKVTLFDTRQAAHALGIRMETLQRWRKEGRAYAKYQMPHKRGAYLWEPDEIRRLLALGNGSRRIFRARRKKYANRPHDGLVIVQPIPKRGSKSGL